MTLSEWIRLATVRLEEAGVESARFESRLLAAHVLMSDRTFILTHPEHELNELAAETVLLRRLAREPLAYILGYREFYGRRFRVAPGVLIPRPETEHIIETALSLPVPADATVLDVGTGAGILAQTLKRERPGWRVFATDVSRDALRIAAENVEGVQLVQGNGLAPFRPAPTFNLIVSNPPYIVNDHPLMPEVGEHEPSPALFGGKDGLDFYRAWVPDGFRRLHSLGHMIVEIGIGQAESVREIFSDAGFERIQVLTDLAGIDRVVVGAKP
jgi:release factor glutamine methyltransferase